MSSLVISTPLVVSIIGCMSMGLLLLYHEVVCVLEEFHPALFFVDVSGASLQVMLSNAKLV